MVNLKYEILLYNKLLIPYIFRKLKILSSQWFKTDFSFDIFEVVIGDYKKVMFWRACYPQNTIVALRLRPLQLGRESEKKIKLAMA